MYWQGVCGGSLSETRAKATHANATSSIHLRQNIASRGQYISALPASVLRLNAKQFALKELPLKLSDKPAPVTIVTVKARTLTPRHNYLLSARAKSDNFLLRIPSASGEACKLGN